MKIRNDWLIFCFKGRYGAFITVDGHAAKWAKERRLAVAVLTKRQVLLIGLCETFMWSKVQYASVQFSRTKCLRFLRFSQFFLRLKCPSVVFFAWEGTKKCESHAQCVSLTLTGGIYVKAR